MELVKKGKTKDVYLLENGNYLLKFKDTVTGHPGGEKDPGGNSVVGEVAGVGSNALNVTSYYFELLKSKKVPTHYVRSDVKKCEMEVRPAKMFGDGLEFVCRYAAYGGFVRRFGAYCKEGDQLDAVFEVTLKDDGRDDPPATKEILAALKLLTPVQYDVTEKMCKEICGVVRDDLKRKGLNLVDIKLEFGIVDGKIMLIDEISGGNMRVYQGAKKLDYLELAELICK
ncbi:MAG: phosphoribosylaminoimidazolesuccinocarboxamide synthase [Firmicutes bacterium]|nr:phosphoribosylaminoimidazolesuccinocarboxamide synthase [Bacillota bacterium]